MTHHGWSEDIVQIRGSQMTAKASLILVFGNTINPSFNYMLLQLF